MISKMVETRLLKSTGDLVSVFKQINTLLCSHNQKIRVPLSPTTRTLSKVEFALLEVIVESSEPRSEWKLKLAGVGITREFKPAYSFMIPGLNRGLHKFVYDVTSVLGSPHVSSEGADLILKYEGGEPFKVLGVLLDSIYTDLDASIKYKHYSGLVGLNPRESFRVDLQEAFEVGSTVRVVAYSVTPSKISISTDNGDAASFSLPAFTLDEFYVDVRESASRVNVAHEKSERPIPILISSITAYRSEVKAPRIDLCNVTQETVGSEVKLNLEICNLGESRPDRLVISIIRSGELLKTLQEDGALLEPGARIVREIRLPMPHTRHSNITVRLIWTKLSKRWFLDRVIRV